MTVPMIMIAMMIMISMVMTMMMATIAIKVCILLLLRLSLLFRLASSKIAAMFSLHCYYCLLPLLLPSLWNTHTATASIYYRDPNHPAPGTVSLSAQNPQT